MKTNSSYSKILGAVVFVFSICISGILYAGGMASGGGDVIVCGKEVYLADTFLLIKRGKLKLDRAIPQELVEESMLLNMKTVYPDLVERISSRLKDPRKFVAVERPMDPISKEELMIKNVQMDPRTFDKKCKWQRMAKHDFATGIVLFIIHSGTIQPFNF